MRRTQYSGFMSTMLVVMIVHTVLKVPFEKAVPPCSSDVPAPLEIIDFATNNFRLYGK